MDSVVVVINGKEVESKKGTTILEAAKSVGIKIPSLCHLEIPEIGYKNNCASCRICIVEVIGRKNLVPACSTYISPGMVINTNTMEVLEKRRNVLELMLSNHPTDCLVCAKNGNCDLQSLAMEFGIRDIRFQGKIFKYRREVSPGIMRDLDKCIMCRRCETMCREIQTCEVLSAINRGFKSIVSTAFEKDLDKTSCTFCGQCVAVCPVGALYEKDYTWDIVRAISDKSKRVIVQVAPAVRVAIGEEFGFAPGEDVTGELITGLRQLGFTDIFDTNFSADLTVMEEENELRERLIKYIHGEEVKIPLMTSCCPGWVKFLENNYGEFKENLSSCKSPQQMFGAVIKNIWGPIRGINRKNIISVSIMPCLAKKMEGRIEEFSKDNNPDIDYSLTTRELAHLFKQSNINLRHLSKGTFDKPLGASSGAADIFGKTGGVMEAVLRTAYENITGIELEDLDFKEVRGLEDTRIADINIGGNKIKVAVVHGLGSARKLMEKIKNKEEDIQVVEVMACKGGCVGGGGQPYHHGDFQVVKNRYIGLEKIDEGKEFRKSHENEDIKSLYEKYLEEPGSNLAKELLHRTYK